MIATNFDNIGIGYDCFQFNGIHQRFAECDVFDTRVVEAIHIIPNYKMMFSARRAYITNIRTVDLLLFVVLIFDGSKK